MNYIVIGEPCVDLIHTAKNEVLHSYGGVLYSVISLAVLAGKTNTVYPVMNLGEDEYDNITSLLGKYTNISLEGIYKVQHSTRKVNLYYNIYNSGKSARFEKSTAPTYAIEYGKIEKFLPIGDAILVNMISGVDISLETLMNIRSNFKGYIHMDIHNLVMKTNDDGTREQTHLDDWRLWCTQPDTLQMNEYEIAIISCEKKKEYEVIEEILINHKPEMKGVIVTRGKNGVSGFTRKEKTFGSKKFFDLDKYDVNAAENPHFIDSTGCGDVFAASFTYDFSINHEFKKSLHYATRIASYKTSLTGIEELNKLK
jgi:hypothetical protein